jgi:hypothetical protein
MRAFALRAKVVNIAQFSSAISFTLMRGNTHWVFALAVLLNDV